MENGTTPSPSHFTTLEKEIFRQKEDFLSSSCYRTSDNLARFLAEKHIPCTKVFALPTRGHLQYPGGPLWENHVAVLVQTVEHGFLSTRVFDLHLPDDRAYTWDEWRNVLIGFPKSSTLQEILTIQFPSQYFCPLKKDISALYKNFIQE